MNINVESILSFKYKTIYNINRRSGGQGQGQGSGVVGEYLASAKLQKSLWRRKRLSGTCRRRERRGTVDGRPAGGQEALEGTKQRCPGDWGAAAKAAVVLIGRRLRILVVCF